MSHSSSTRMPPPSAMVKPSRSTSNGRDTPLLDNAVMLLKPAMAVGVSGASAPPAMTTSARPSAIMRAAFPMAWVPAAQAVTVFSHGPCQPYFIEMAAAGAFAIIIGTRNGDTRRSPLPRRTSIWSSSVPMPPTPVPTNVARRAGSAVSSPAISSACSAAARAYCVQGSLRRASLGLSK